MYLIEGLAAFPKEEAGGKPSSLVVARQLTDPTARIQFKSRVTSLPFVAYLTFHSVSLDVGTQYSLVTTSVVDPSGQPLQY